MSELYSTSTDIDTGTEASEPAAETSTANRTDHGDIAADQYQDDAAIEAGLDEADLPTRAESRAATWGPDSTNEGEEPDLGPESADAAIEAGLDEADLPTRAESRAATWGPDATSEADEPSLGRESEDAAIEAKLDEADLPTRAESRAQTWRADATGDTYETELGAEYDGGPGAIAAGPDRLPARQDSPSTGTGQKTDAGTSESTIPGEQATDNRSGTGPLPATATDRIAHDQQELLPPAQGGHEAPVTGDEGRSPVTHFHSEFTGHSLDLYTDGSRWATVDRPRAEDMVSGKADVPDRLPTGEEIVKDAGEGTSLADRLRRELYEASDDEIDLLEKDTNLVHDVFSRPSSSSYESTPANHPYISEAQHSGIDPGSTATALFTLGLVIDRGVRWTMRYYGKGAKRR
jgi:hypothetical protein